MDEMALAAELPQADATSLVDRALIEARVRSMYRDVARERNVELHFAIGRELALRLGYPRQVINAVPSEAVASFAGVGHHLDLAALSPGECVLDLGSGSGMDAFAAACAVGPTGRVVGVDFTDDQLAKARRLRDRDGFEHVEFVDGTIDELPFPDGTFDAVVSNGVINLSPVKHGVFAEAARVLKPERNARGLRHRQRPGAAGADAAERRALGSLRRRRDSARELPRGARRRRLPRHACAHERLQLHLGAHGRSLQPLRDREHLPGGGQGAPDRLITVSRPASWRAPRRRDRERGR